MHASERPPSSLPTLFKNLHNVASTPADGDSSKSLKTKEILREELGAWWHKNTARDPTMNASTRSRSVDGRGGDHLAATSRPYNTIPPNPRRSSTPSASLSNSSSSHLPSTPAVPTGREHLHYRDENAAPTSTSVSGASYGFNSTTAAPMMGRSSSIQKPPVDDEEENSLKRAIEESKKELAYKSSQAAREESELQKALEASARSPPTPTSTFPSEQSQLSAAILASQRQLLLDSQRRRPTPPPTLKESEWQLRSRNEKGALWAEAGSHGWLPPGARRAEPEEDRERQMLELALRISLEEEEARNSMKVVTAPAIPPRPTTESRETYASSTTSSGGDVPALPYRPVPPPPTHPSRAGTSGDMSRSSSYTQSLSNYGSPPLSPTSPRTRPLSFIAPSPPKIFTHESPDRHSPQEMPYLTPSGSIRNLAGMRDERLLGKGEEVQSTPSPHSSNDHGTFGSREDEGEGTSEGSLSVRNPDPVMVEEPEVLPYTPTEPVFPEFHSTMAGRSLSLLSEHTEPSRTSSLEVESGSGHTSPMLPLTGTDKQDYISDLISPGLAKRAPPPAPTRPPPQPPSTHVGSIVGEVGPSAGPAEVDTEVPPTIATATEGFEQRTVFGDGVRFGWPAPCAQKHACAADGLHSEAPFPDQVMLSVVETGEDNELGERGKFSVEGRTWVGLLRFLMWYGDTTIQASSADLDATEDHHCDATMSLEFRKDDEGAGVLRLTVSLLPPNSRPPTSELTASEPPITGKGKARSRASSSAGQATIFTLPDTQVLPTRLSSIAITLYSLRHLAGIAASTQPAKDAQPSYHALRYLSQSINALAKEHAQTDDAGRTNKSIVDEERLLGKLRDRLKKMRLGGSERDPANLKGARLTKAPPQASKATPVGRNSRVLADTDADTMPLNLGAVLPPEQ